MHATPYAWTRVILTLYIVSLLPAAFSAGHVSGEEDQPTWTVMMYMAADTDKTLPWQEDINEMEAAAMPDWLNVIALVDPYGTGDSFLLRIVQDVGYNDRIVSPEIDDDGAVIPAGGEADMASSRTLRDFVLFASDGYPADRYALFLWGHGGGWYGLCEDQAAVMSLPDLAYGLSSATEELGRRLDLVVVDACAEGVLETMYEIRDYADFYVGSERNVPAEGLRYDLVLGSLVRNPAVGPEEWGSYICETHTVSQYFESTSATMGVFDLSQMDEFVDRLMDYWESARGYADLYGDRLTGALLQAASSDFLSWYRDAGDILRKSANAFLPLETRHLAFDALMAYDLFVIDFHVYASPFDAEFGSVVNSTGASVYLPGADLVDEAYWTLSFAGTGWADASEEIRSSGETVPNGASPEVLYEDSDGDGSLDQAVVMWPPGHDRYEAWVFAQSASGMQFVSKVQSAGPNMTLAGFAGELTVSASAWDGDDARSHHTLNVVLERNVQLMARVMWHGEAVTDGLSVRVLTAKGSVELSRSDDGFSGSVLVPADADYGELVTVEVRSRSGELLAQNRTYVQGAAISVEIHVFGERTEALGPEFVIPAAVLVASAFAVALYSQSRGRGRDRS